MTNILIGATGSVATIKVPLIVNLLKQSWKKISDPILHIQLRDWADIMVIAPLDANTMGKIANGLCDNLLTCILRAWNVMKPVIACPAMNTSIYQLVVNTYDFLGIGAMAEASFIVEYTIDLLKKQAVQ
ncbi:flavo protein [Rhizopus microsporus]|uniref:Flavo protein n=1 Tax=Rhizopus microsporus TaxID=58291 RepID=A0A1X0S8R2_RHIZD|nr:flavo protein [Rhizopus microsporus]